MSWSSTSRRSSGSVNLSKGFAIGDYKVINYVLGSFIGEVTDWVFRRLLNVLTVHAVRDGDEKELTVGCVQFLDSGIVEVCGVGLDACLELNTFVLLGLFLFLLDDVFDCGQVVFNLNSLIIVERSNHFGDRLDGDQLADCSVKDGSEDVGLDVLSHVEAKSFHEDSIDLGLVDELIAYILKVREEVFGNIDLVLELMVSVRVKLLPCGIAGVALRVAVARAMVATLGGICLGKRLVVLGEVDGLADGDQASDRKLSSHGFLLDFVFCLFLCLFRAI